MADGEPDSLELQRLGFRVAASRYVMAGRSFRRRLDVADWSRELRLSLGETDLL